MVDAWKLSCRPFVSYAARTILTAHIDIAAFSVMLILEKSVGPMPHQPHKLLPDMPTILDQACYSRTDPDLQKGGSAPSCLRTVSWGACGQNTARLGDRVYRHADGSCGLSSAYLDGRDVDLTETDMYRMVHCATADQSKARIDDCFEVKSSNELLNYL